MKVQIYGFDGKVCGVVDIPSEIIDAAYVVHTWMDNNNATHLGGLTLRTLQSKDSLHLSKEIYEELSAKQQAELAEKYEVTVAKRAYSNGGM